MEDFEETYKNAVEAGRSNLKAAELLSNWCYHAELVRSPGRGMIEDSTGLPIGHMGVQCKFSKTNSMLCWLLEDAAYDFYRNNCKDCTERAPVGIPNILLFIDPREKAAAERRKEREIEAVERENAHAKRREKRAELRSLLSLEETFVFDLLEELDQEDIDSKDPRLEQLANLAPETFTRTIVEHLLPAVLDGYLPYSIPAARALLNTSIAANEKIAVAMFLIGNFVESPTAIEIIIEYADRLERADLNKALRCFTYRALGPPPGMHLGGDGPILLDAVPIQSLFEKRRDDVLTVVSNLFADTNSSKIGMAVEIILATNDRQMLEMHTRTIFAKLMRRRTLLPDERNRDSSVLYFLRQAASLCFGLFPDKVDSLIQSFLTDNDAVGRTEASRIYTSALSPQFDKPTKIGMAQKIAFKRLLWTAVESSGSGMDDAGQFFRRSWDQFAQLAAEHFDDLIGAAASLSAKYEAVGTERYLELNDDALAEMERRNRRTAIDSLQGSLIEWAAVGARSKGSEGIVDFLGLYRRLPEDQTQMRGNMIAHVSNLLTGVESLTLVLSDWYRALMDDNALIRASAAQAWEHVPSDLVKNFPNLFFEAISVLLLDPYVIVHTSVVHSLRRRSIPKECRHLIKDGLWDLISYYSQREKHNEFVVDCIGTLSSLCLTSEEREGRIGEILAKVLLTLERGALYRAIDRLRYEFGKTPGFFKVALKAMQEDYTRSVSIDGCMAVILDAPCGELRGSLDEIRKAFESLRPFRKENFIEALFFATVLSKAEGHSAASALFNEFRMSIKDEDRNKKIRSEMALIVTACDTEDAIRNGADAYDKFEAWTRQIAELEKENEERAESRNLSRDLFFKN